MIRFFISSTFRDMQSERDAIHRTIYPVIRKYGLEKGVNVDVCDLRWGIDFNKEWTEEQANEEIMKVCFKEVKDCKPHIISMIGNYYGSRATDKERIVGLWKKFGRNESELPEDRDISLTQWELEFAFLSKKNNDIKSLCLFKDEPDKAEAEVKVLKERILAKSKQSKGKIKCVEYQTTDDFERLFIDYAKEIIDKEARESSTRNWVQKELSYADAYSYVMCSGFGGRSKGISAFRAFASDPGKVALGFYGPSGIGKSSLMAKLYQQSKRNFNSYFIACGSSQKSSRYLNILIEIIYVLERIYLNKECAIRDNLYTESSAEKYLERILEKSAETELDQKVILFVDAMDKLSVGGSNKLIRLFARTNPRDVKIVCSQITPYDESFALKSVEFFALEPLGRKEIIRIFEQKMYDPKQRREFDSGSLLAESILQKEGSSSPLYINTAITILKMHMAGSENLKSQNDYFISLIKKMPDDLAGLIWYAIEEALQYVLDEKSDDKEKDGVKHALGLIGISRHGLKEADLERILIGNGWKSVVFSSVRLFLSDYFRQQEDGCWVFEHDIIKTTVVTKVSGLFQTELALERMLYDYINSSDCEDIEIKMREGLYLSFLFGNADLTSELFKLLREDGSMILRTIAAKELYSILYLDKGLKWFHTVARAFTCELIRGINCLLELQSNDDYERRVPAKYAADMLFDLMGVKGRYDIKRWCSAEGRSFEDRFEMASLCTEYVAAHDSLGDYIHSLEFEFYPFEFFRDENNAKLFTEEQKSVAYRHLNTLFNINNNLLSNVNRLSRQIMEWHSKDPFGFNDDDNEENQIVNRMFVANRGQYYSAIDNLEKSLPFRVRSMIDRANAIFGRLGEAGETFREEFYQLCHITENRNLHMSDFMQFDLHDQHAFWERVEDYVLNSHFDKALIDSIGYLWLRLGYGYRLMSYDINKIPADTDDYSLIIRKGCECSEIAVSLFGSILVQNERELFGAELRRIQIYSKRDDLTIDELSILCDRIASAVDDYSDNARDYGPHDGEALRDALKAIKTRWEKKLSTDAQNFISNAIIIIQRLIDNKRD